MRECLVWPDGGSQVGAWTGMAYNISASGIGVALPYPLSAGTALVLVPWSRQRVREVRARVVRSARESFLWFHGCEFIAPLTDDELQSWLT
jgi:hypothetical protein